MEAVFFQNNGEHLQDHTVSYPIICYEKCESQKELPPERSERRCTGASHSIEGDKRTNEEKKRRESNKVNIEIKKEG
jgi:hypothetical protein